MEARPRPVLGPPAPSMQTLAVGYTYSTYTYMRPFHGDTIFGGG
jgi:hypothetical protein